MSTHSTDAAEKTLHGQSIEEEFYRNYHLLSRYEKDKWIGEIFKDKVRIAYCESSGQASSLQHLRNIVDNLIKDAIVDRKNAIPSQSELSEAIQSSFANLPSSLKKFVKHVNSSHENQFTMEQLSQITGCKSTTDISLLMAQFARTISDVVAYEPPAQIDGRDPYLANLLEVNENCPNNKIPITLTLNQHIHHAIIKIEGPLT